MTDSIVAKVAAVMDDTTLVLNAGSQQGVSEGMLFDIVAQHQEIADPDTGESLGQWEVAKARVVVTHVQEKMSTVRTPLAEEIEASSTLSTLMVRHSFGLYGERRGERTSLDVRANSMSGRPAAKPIEVGDPARSVTLMERTEIPEPAAGQPGARGAEDLPSTTYDSYLTESDDSDLTESDDSDLKESSAPAEAATDADRSEGDRAPA